MNTVARHVTVTGRVQGVCYRAAVRDWCVKNDITGWIKNIPDGSVQMVVEGEQNTITQCLEMVRKGSVHSRVDTMEVHGVPVAHYTTFTVIVHGVQVPQQAQHGGYAEIDPVP